MHSFSFVIMAITTFVGTQSMHTINKSAEAQLLELMWDRLNDDNKTIPLIMTRPVPENDRKVYLALKIYMKKILNFDLRHEVLTAMVEQQIEWTNHHVSWRPQDYDFVERIKFPLDHIWHAQDIVNTNALQRRTVDTGAEQYVLIMSDGANSYSTHIITTLHCESDMWYFPFDEHECTMQWGSWFHDHEKLELQDPEEEEMDLSHYVDCSKWQIVDTVVEPTYFVETGNRYTSINNKFIMVSKARTTYVEIILVPSALLAFMPILIFLLPITGSSRSFFGLKLLLINYFLLAILSYSWYPSTKIKLLKFYTYLLPLIAIDIALGFIIEIMWLNNDDMKPCLHKILVKKLGKLMRVYDMFDARMKADHPMTRFRYSRIPLHHTSRQAIRRSAVTSLPPLEGILEHKMHTLGPVTSSRILVLAEQDEEEEEQEQVVEEEDDAAGSEHSSSSSTSDGSSSSSKSKKSRQSDDVDEKPKPNELVVRTEVYNMDASDAESAVSEHSASPAKEKIESKDKPQDNPQHLTTDISQKAALEPSGRYSTSPVSDRSSGIMQQADALLKDIDDHEQKHKRKLQKQNTNRFLSQDIAESEDKLYSTVNISDSSSDSDSPKELTCLAPGHSDDIEGVSVPRKPPKKSRSHRKVAPIDGNENNGNLVRQPKHSPWSLSQIFPKFISPVRVFLHGRSKKEANYGVEEVCRVPIDSDEGEWSGYNDEQKSTEEKEMEEPTVDSKQRSPSYDHYSMRHTSITIPTRKSMEALAEASVEASTVVSVQVSTRASVEVQAEGQAEVSVEVPAEVTAEAPVEVTTEAPTEVSIEVPAEVSTEVPAEVTDEAPPEVTVEVPVCGSKTTDLCSTLEASRHMHSTPSIKSHRSCSSNRQPDNVSSKMPSDSVSCISQTTDGDKTNASQSPNEKDRLLGWDSQTTDGDRTNNNNASQSPCENDRLLGSAEMNNRNMNASSDKLNVNTAKSKLLTPSGSAETRASTSASKPSKNAPSSSSDQRKVSLPHPSDQRKFSGPAPVRSEKLREFEKRMSMVPHSARGSLQLDAIDRRDRKGSFDQGSRKGSVSDRKERTGSARGSVAPERKDRGSVAPERKDRGSVGADIKGRTNRLESTRGSVVLDMQQVNIATNQKRRMTFRHLANREPRPSLLQSLSNVDDAAGTSGRARRRSSGEILRDALNKVDTNISAKLKSLTMHRTPIAVVDDLRPSRAKRKSSGGHGLAFKQKVVVVDDCETLPTPKPPETPVSDHSDSEPKAASSVERVQSSHSDAPVQSGKQPTPIPSKEGMKVKIESQQQEAEDGNFLTVKRLSRTLSPHSLDGARSDTSIRSSTNDITRIPSEISNLTNLWSSEYMPSIEERPGATAERMRRKSAAHRKKEAKKAKEKRLEEKRMSIKLEVAKRIASRDWKIVAFLFNCLCLVVNLILVCYFLITLFPWSGKKKDIADDDEFVN